LEAKNISGGDDKHLELIEHLYQLAIDPFSFDDLLAEWETTLQQAIQHQKGTIELGVLESHAFRAVQILEKLDTFPDAPTPPPLSDVIELDPSPAILLSAQGVVIAANQVARTHLGVQIGKSLADCLQDEFASSSDWQALIDKLKATTTRAQGVLGLFAISPTAARQSVLLALSRAHCPQQRDIAGLLTALAPVWSEQTQNAVKEFFGLTSSELEIVRELTGGRDAAQIAETRQTSLHTVRSQIKSVLSKTNFSSQLDLIRHMGFLQRFAPASDRSPQARAPNGQSAIKTAIAGPTTYQLSNGRALEYVQVGPADGTPILFLHGIIDSNRFPAAVIDQLYDRSIRLIVPTRPNYGGSDPYVSDENGLAECADDICALLNYLGIERLALIGHMAGTVYGIALASRHPDRISSILSIAGAVPMVHRSQFSAMSTGHRIAGLTARYAPLLLPVLVRGGIQLIRRGEQENMLNLLFKDAPLDLAIAQNAEIKELMFDRFDFVTRQGHQAFASDLKIVSSDWSHLMEQMRCPLSIVHGSHDQVVLLGGVQAFAAHYSHCELHVSVHSGQLVLFSDTELVFDTLERLIRPPVLA